MFNMALIFFDLEFTDKEKDAIPVVIGALLRERHKVDLIKLTNLIKQFIPQI